MQDGNEIEIYYRWRELDKCHEYGVVCKQNEKTDYANYWIFWIWFKMGVAFGKSYRKKFRLIPYSNDWAENCKLIKSYKTVNNGTDRVVPAILSHFKKLKKK